MAKERPTILPSVKASGVLADVERLIAADSLDEAEALARAGLAVSPKNGDLINALGCICSARGQTMEALGHFRDALRYSPNSAGIWNNLGAAFKQKKYYLSAERCHRKAVELSPGEAFLEHNLALCLAESGQHGEAIQSYSRTFALDPQLKLAIWGRARSYLFLGNYQEGWKDYNIRLVTGQLPDRPRPGQPWDGQVYAGKRLTILAEQGFGDTIWAARYLRKVKGLGGELVVECQPQLYSLISSLNIADWVIPAGDPLPDSDYHSYFCSLPSLFPASLDRISGESYMSASPWRARKFRTLFKPYNGLLKVGIVWSGSVMFARNDDRALSLAQLIQAVDVPGVQIFSLQKGSPERELTNLGPGHEIVDLAPELNDFADTAAAISELDLVIMTDSAVAHLCGSLGKKVWVLLGYSAHWLWLLDRRDSPWYSSMKLIRQKFEGDWTSVLDRVTIELMDMSSVIK